MQDCADKNATGSQMQNKPEWRHKLPSIPIILLVALIIVTVLHIPLSVFPVGRDQGVWATAGLAINNGAVFFKDYLHFNLPGLGISYALALKSVSDPRMATMLVSLAGSILIIIGMYLLLLQTVNKTAAAWAVILFSVIWPTYIDFWGIAQKDFMAMYGVLLGTWLMARSKPQASYRHLSIYSAGFAVGLAIMYKPLFAITGILLAVIQAANFFLQPVSTGKESRKDWRTLFYDLSLLLAGALTIALLFLCYLVSGNALEGLHNGLFVFAPAYSGIYKQPILRQLTVLFANTAIIATPLDWSALIHYLLWTPIVLSGLFMLSKHAFTREKAWLYVPFLTALFTYLIQGKSFGYHTIPWQICLFMAAGYWFGWVQSNSKNPDKHKKTSLIIILVVGIIFGRSLFLTHYAKAEVPTWLNLISREKYLQESYVDINPEVGIPSPAASEELAQWLQKNSQPEDKILVWGLECQLYVLANRMYVTHSPFDFLLTTNLANNAKAFAWQKIIREQFMRQLEAERPKFIVIVSSDMNTVEPVPSNEAAAFVPGFQSLVDNQYHKIKSIHPFDVYQRNP